MTDLSTYFEHVKSRSKESLPPLPLTPDQTASVIDSLKSGNEEFLDLLLSQVEAGANESARHKATFLKQVALGQVRLKGLSESQAIAHLGYMKGGYNISALVDLLQNDTLAPQAVVQLSKLVLIHQSFKDVVALHDTGNTFATQVLEAWAKAQWYLNAPKSPQEIDIVVYKIPDSIEASTDFLSHSKGGHTRTDIAKHAQEYFMTKEMLVDLKELKSNNPMAQVVLVADKLGTSSSRKSGMNNVEYNIGIENDMTRFVPNKKTRAIMFAGRTLGPIFAKTAQDMGSIIVRTNVDDLQTGDKLVLALSDGKVFNDKGDVVCTFTDPSSDTLEAVRVGGGLNFRMGKILTANASKVLKKNYLKPYMVNEVNVGMHGAMTAAQKVMATASGLDYVTPDMTIYANVDTVASQDTTGPMTVQELQTTLASTKLAVPLFLQSQCHNAALGFRNEAVVVNNTRLADFVKSIGGLALKMGDGIIHVFLNEMVMPNTIVVGADSHTRTPTALSFPLGSGGVAEAAATGVTEIIVPESVLVVLQGELRTGITIRDLVNYIPYKAQEIYGQGSNIFEGRLIEFRRIGTPFNMNDAFALANASAERSATACFFEHSGSVVAHHLETQSIPLLENLIKEGYDVQDVLQHRLNKMKRFAQTPKTIEADKDAVYASVIEIDLNEIDQPYIACPHTPDNVKPLSEISGTQIDFGFVGSCMAGMNDFVVFNQLTQTAPKLVVETWLAPPTRFLEAKLNAQGILQDLKAKGARVEVAGCSLCMGNQERIVGVKNVLTTSTRNFKGRMGDQASVYLASSELQAITALTGKLPSVSEYFAHYFKEIKNG